MLSNEILAVAFVGAVVAVIALISGKPSNDLPPDKDHEQPDPVTSVCRTDLYDPLTGYEIEDPVWLLVNNPTHGELRIKVNRWTGEMYSKNGPTYFSSRNNRFWLSNPAKMCEVGMYGESPSGMSFITCFKAFFTFDTMNDKGFLADHQDPAGDAFYWVQEPS